MILLAMASGAINDFKMVFPPKNKTSLNAQKAKNLEKFILSQK